jgi:hypothetical protein
MIPINRSFVHRSRALSAVVPLHNRPRYGLASPRSGFIVVAHHPDGKLNEPFRSASGGGRAPRHLRIRSCSGDLLKRESQRICRQRTTFDDLDNYISSLAFQSRTYTKKSGDGPRTN